MGAALREAWLWLLLAFILGFAIGYFLKNRLARDGATADKTTAGDPAATARIAALEAELEERRAATPALAAANAPVATSIAKASAASTTTTKTTPRKPNAKAAALDLVAAKTALGTTVKLDDLKLIEGIGPRIEALFKADGVTTWRELSKANVERLQGVLDAAGPRYKMHNPGSWPKQAGLLADGKWAEFKTLTDKLKDGR